MSNIKSLTQFNFYSEIEETSGHSLVYFSAHACSSCKHLTMVLNELHQHDASLSIFKIDAQQDQALVSEYDVSHLPALFLFKDGQFHAELSCESRPDSILRCIESASQRAAEDAP